GLSDPEGGLARESPADDCGGEGRCGWRSVDYGDGAGTSRVRPCDARVQKIPGSWHRRGIEDASPRMSRSQRSMAFMRTVTATTDFHPAKHRRLLRGTRGPTAEIPQSGNADVKVGGRVVHLTHLEKLFWPELGITKGDLLRY